MMFGPHDSESTHSKDSMKWKIKVESNDTLRQRFIDRTVEQAHHIGLTIPDKNLKYNKATMHWEISPINWDEFWNVVKGNGQCNYQRMSHHIRYHNEGKWVRDCAAAFEKSREKENSSISI